MKLIVLRHGDAVQSTRYQDAERPLTDLGKEQAREAGSILRASGEHVATIITSPLTRARETGRIVREILGAGEVGVSEFLVPSTSKRQLLHFLNTPLAGPVLLVGHEPHLSELVALLLTGAERPLFELGKCSLAAVEVPPPVRPGGALLLWLRHVSAVSAGSNQPSTIHS